VSSEIVRTMASVGSMLSKRSTIISSKVSSPGACLSLTSSDNTSRLTDDDTDDMIVTPLKLEEEQTTITSTAASLIPSDPHNDDVDNEDDDESTSTASSSSSSSIASECQGLARLEREQDRRMERLLRICAATTATPGRRRPSYFRLLQAHQAAVKALAIAQYKEQHQHMSTEKNTTMGSRIATIKGNNQRISTNEEQHQQQQDPPPPLHHRIWWWLLFESHFTVPSIWKLLAICMGHLTVYNFLDVVTKTVHHNVIGGMMGNDMFNVVLTLFGLALLRANGFLFTLLDKQSMKITKFEMTNRQQLGHRDGRLMVYLNKDHPWMGSTCNLLGFYLIYCAFVYFYNHRIHPAFYVPLDDWYASIRNNAIKMALDDGINSTTAITHLSYYYRADSKYGSSVGWTYGMLSGTEDETCAIITEHIPNNLKLLRWWFNWLCYDPGQEFRIHDILFHGFWFTLTAAVSAWMGVNVLTLCDDEGMMSE
jgi:hypothetical protein